MKKTDLLKRIISICFFIILIAGIYLMGKQIIDHELVSMINVCVIEILICLVAYCAWRSGLFFLFLPVAVGSIILVGCTFFFGVTPINKTYLIQAIASVVALVASLILFFMKVTTNKKNTTHLPKIPCIITCVLLLTALAAWIFNIQLDRNSSVTDHTNLWAVPSVYDSQADAHAGTLEQLTYQTKAYATDQRDVTKTAYVYLPYEYDASQSYNILYLMHGTGDNEAYWLLTNPKNKTMVDRMISLGVIDPLIIVTPTFYVEDDCADDLDQLTYSFNEELRNDLMPAVENKYSTYAATCDQAGFTDSRDHRAFAGLSRGAVTTFHSALCGSLDYFSWFGTFSGCRTDGTDLQETIQQNGLENYDIHRLYMTSGSFDFSLSGQLTDYASLLEAEPRLVPGENTSFDIFPMRYHSMGSWHLALYNFLPQIFN